ncbi:MAG TPA: glycosyltransferase family 39 protein [bacterium]|nr:glycosyltransferase family 39 protein [bacterium]HPQ66730.1 glycosyltransferase family 39 protein [bacterium]
MIYDFYSTNLAETGGFGYVPPGDAFFGRTGFTPRYFIYAGGGEKTFPRKFPGFILAWAGWKALLPSFPGKLINPAAAAAAVVLVYLIARRFHPRGPAAAGAAVLLAVNPILIHRAYMYNPTVFNLLFFLLSLWFLLEAVCRGGTVWFALLGLASGCFLWIRPTNVVYLAGLAGLIFWERRRVRGPARFLLSLAVLAAGVGALLWYNSRVFGSWLSLGYTAATRVSGEVMGVKAPLSVARILDYLNFHPSIWINHVRMLPLTLTLAFPPLVLALIGIFGGDDEPDRPRFRPFYLLLFALAVGFFSNFGTYGHEEGELTLHSSFLRYLLPALALLCIPAAAAIGRFPRPRRALAAAVGLSLAVAVLAPGGVVETTLQSAYYGSVRVFIMNRVPASGVLFSHYWDKTAFPERTVYTHGTQLPEPGVGDAVADVLARGREAWTTSHPCDALIREEAARRGWPLEPHPGPEALSPVLRKASAFIPPSLYPLTLYRIRPGGAAGKTAP